jgi:hypothetical protein
MKLGYAERLIVACVSGVMPPGELSQVSVVHDAECPALSGRKCVCIPAITITVGLSGRTVFTVDADGNTHLEPKQ